MPTTVSDTQVSPLPSSPHPTPSEWLEKAISRLNEPGGFVYQNDLVLIADLSHALSVTLDMQGELLVALKAVASDRHACGTMKRRAEAAIAKAEGR